MSNLQPSEFNYDKRCRTCLKLEKDIIRLNSIYGDSTSIDIPDLLSLFRLKLSKDDGFPQSICNECTDSLMYINTFRKLCENSQLTLERFCKTEQLVSIELISIPTQDELEFVDVEFLQNVQEDIATEQNLEIQQKEEIIPDDGVSSSNDEWNQNETESHSKEILNKSELHNVKCDQVCSNIEDLALHENYVCHYCNQIFETTHLLDSHIKCAHTIKNRTHICTMCGKHSATTQNHNRHLESHNKTFAYKCDICDSEFKCKNYLAKHKRAIHTFKELECPQCFMKFNNSNKYKYHLKTHEPNKKYKCQYCEKSFLQHHHLSNHERVHTGLRPYLCNICGKNFPLEQNLTLHIRTHTGDRPYVCSLCGKGFAQRGSFMLHKRHHSGIRPYQCENCGKNFYQKSSLNVHLRTHTGERPFKCDLCNKAFIQLPHLKHHTTSVHGTKPNTTLKDLDNVEPVPIEKTVYKPKNDVEIPGESTKLEKPVVKQFLFKCSLCIKEFKLPSSLASHMKIHSEDRKHGCTECGITFKRNEHLRKHINGVHLKQKPYACKLCPKTFSQVGDRNRHVLSHTGEKPHSCPHCSKRFRLQKALNAHVRIHTGEKPYKCEICNNGYITYNALVVHTVKHPKSLLNLAKENCLNQYLKTY